MRNFTAGYFLTPLNDHALLRGCRYENAFPCGVVNGQSFTYIIFSPDGPEKYPDSFGQHQEMFDMSADYADHVCENALFQKACQCQDLTGEDLSGFSSCAIACVQACLADGCSIYDAVMMNIAFLIPEACGATFDECVARGYLIQETITDPDTGQTFTRPNIWRCSLENGF